MVPDPLARPGASQAPWGALAGLPVPALRRRVERLEATHRPAGERVRYAWWRAGAPRPEPTPGERLVVIRWADHEGDAPSPSPEAELVPENGR